MSTKEQVLTALAESAGAPVSGEQLAAQLGVTRTSIWKAVRGLQQDGYRVSAVPNRGYLLEAFGDRLCAPGIRRYLRHKNLLLTVERSLVSTNLTARQLAAQGAPHGTLVAAEQQTGGRGRLGRSFHSPAGTGLYLSVILRSALAINSAVLVTSAAAVAVCRAMQKAAGRELFIKWVNDLYTGPRGRKCCGILTEAQAGLEAGGVDHLVVGIGVNLLEPEGGWPESLRDVAGAVFRSGEPFDRNRIAAAITDELLDLFDALPDTGFLAEYRARNIVPGHRVHILQAGTQREADALAITDEGHLLVRLPDGHEETLSFGEVSIRLGEEQPV